MSQEKENLLLSEIVKLQKEQHKLFEQFQLVTENQERLLNLVEQNISLNRSVFRKLALRLQPKLSVLKQYSPKPMEIPTHYHHTGTTNNNFPSICIVTPSFNQGHFIEKTIKSVLDQNYPKLEYIIQDGGSKDNTVNIIQKYDSQLTHWKSAPDKGQSNAINLGLKKTHGEIMAYLNSDDLLLPGSLHYVADYFQKHPDVDVVYGHRVIINENDDEIGRWVLPPHDDQTLQWADYIPQETLFWRRSMWNKVNAQIDESFRFAMDWDLILRFIDVKAKFVRLPRFLGAFRVHSSQKTSSEITSTGFNEMRKLRQRCHGRHVTEQEIRHHTRNYLWLHVILHKAYRLGLLKY